MKKGVIYYMLTMMAIGTCCLSCNDHVEGENSSQDNVVDNVLGKVPVDWNASRNQVQKKVKGFKLIASDPNSLQYTDAKGEIKLSYSFVNDSLQAIAMVMPKLADKKLSAYLAKYEELGEVSSKKVYYDTDENTMCFSYDIESEDTELSIIGLTPIVSNLFQEDIRIKVDYKNLSYNIDGNQYKMVLVDGGELPDFYIMQTEVPLKSDFTIAGTSVGMLDANEDNCIIKSELRRFIRELNEVTGLEFRLPTEEEWMFAAKGGSKSNIYTYSGSNDINDVAWYSGNCKEAKDVALKQPNELGLYDMSGNFAEVCSSDPVHIDGKTYGGCWKYAANQCTPGSYRAGNSSASKIPGTSIKELNAVDGRYITVRLVYSSPE